MERDSNSPSSTESPSNFNSHAHVERDGWECAPATDKQNFNSHAHVERDDAIAWALGGDKYISTHTLTWSVTVIVVIAHIDPQFQLTRSRGA